LCCENSFLGITEKKLALVMKCSYTSWCRSALYLCLYTQVYYSESLNSNAELHEIYQETLHAVIMVLHILSFQKVAYIWYFYLL
jgi:hypothetical protein